MSMVQLGYVCSHLQNVSAVRKTITSIPLTKLHLQVSLGLYKAGFISSIQRGSVAGPDKEFTRITQANVSTRRLWLGLKYQDYRPILKNFHLVSRPNRRIILDAEQIKTLAVGKTVRKVEPAKPGEVLFVKLEKIDAVVDLMDAAKKGLGGEVLCRAS